MKKTLCALSVILILSCSLWVSANNLATANPFSGGDKTVWIIESPLNHTLYNTNVVNFSFKITTNDLWDEFDNGLNLTYCLDGSDFWKAYEGGTYVHVLPPDEERIFIKADLISDQNISRKTFQYSTLLSNLSEGKHRLTMYFWFKSWGPDSPWFGSTEYEGIIFYVNSSASVSETRSFTDVESKPELTPQLSLIIITLVAVVGVGAIAYFKKRKP